MILVADPARPEKNFKLCREAIEQLGDPSVELLAIYNKTHEEVARYMTAADVLMLTSFTEGSPNVIKEAMAANCPVVTTNVGDVKEVIGNTEGCHIMDTFEAAEGAEKLKKALVFGRKNNGRERIIALGLDDLSIAKKINAIYTEKR